MFPGMPQRQWKCLMYYRRYLSQYISVPNVTIVFSQLLYIRLYHALLEMAGLGTTDRLDGIKRSHHASCHYRTRIHLVQSMDRHGLSDEQVRSYFTGPAHLPWHRMSNVDYWQSPLPQSWLKDQEELQKRILEENVSLI